MENKNSQQRTQGHLVAGVIVVGLGIAFLIRNMGIFPPEFNHYIFSWKTFLIGVGLVNLFMARNYIPGVILISLGTFFWLPEWFNLSLRAGQLFWPLIIIIVGLILLFKRPNPNHPRRPWRKHSRHQEYGNDKYTSSEFRSYDKDSNNAFASDQEFIDDVAIFSGSSKKIVTPNFRGGRMTAIFGGSELNLSRSRLAPGDNILHVFFMFGGSEIVVPSDWNVVIEATPVFGGFSDERYVSKDLLENNPEKPRLIIKGLVIFGGAELKSY